MPFQAVYREHFASIWRAMRRFGVAERDAEDAAQEVFVIAYRAWDKFEGRSSLRTWLFGIAFRVAAGRRRLLPARREVLGDEGLSEAITAADDPELSLEKRELLGLLDAGLASLPLEQRAVLILFELEGFSGEEIATSLELPLGTVRSRLRLGRAAFSRAVRALGAEPHETRPVEALEASHD